MIWLVWWAPWLLWHRLLPDLSAPPHARQSMSVGARHVLPHLHQHFCDRVSSQQLLGDVRRRPRGSLRSLWGAEVAAEWAVGVLHTLVLHTLRSVHVHVYYPGVKYSTYRMLGECYTWSTSKVTQKSAHILLTDTFYFSTASFWRRYLRYDDQTVVQRWLMYLLYQTYSISVNKKVIFNPQPLIWSSSVNLRSFSKAASRFCLVFNYY